MAKQPLAKNEMLADLLMRSAEQSEQDALRAIAARAIHAKGAYDQDVTAKYNNTNEAWGYNVLMTSVFFELVMILMRLWDDRKDVLSLPRAKSIVTDDSFTKWFIEQERERSKTFSPNLREEIIRAYLEKFHCAYDAAKGHHSKSRLRDLRNQLFAHNADQKVGQTAKYGYADELIEMTIPVAETINIVARSHEFHGKEFVEEWSKRADDFWTTSIKGLAD